MSSLQDVYVIEDKADVFLWGSAAITLGEVAITGIADMVSKVQALAKTKRVRELRIVGHGSAHGQYIGKDWLSITSLAKTFRPDFVKLSVGCFGPGGFITMGGCEQGENGGLLLEISNIVGVPVQGFTAAQRVLPFGDEGGLTRCFITCAREGKTFADSVDKLLGQGQ